MYLFQSRAEGGQNLTFPETLSIAPVKSLATGRIVLLKSIITRDF